MIKCLFTYKYIIYFLRYLYVEYFLMKRIILSEGQVKKVIDKILSEQQVSEFNAGTDAQKISHVSLSKSFGLPDGANHENYYYGANIADVIQISGSGDRTKFLSIFKPANKYNENPKGYLDSIYVNNESLQNSGTKTFRFVSGNVYATHNGLLALTRAMDQMGGRGGTLTISFGSNTSGKQAEAERMSSGVKFDSNRALNQTPIINNIENQLVYLSVNPNFKDKGLFIGVKREMSNDEIISFVERMVVYLAEGSYGFMDFSKKDEIIKNLNPKGFLQINPGIRQHVQKIISLQNMPDFLPDNNDNLTKYNENKRNQLNSVGSSFMEDLFNRLKTTYMKNFELYVQNYLPNSAAQIMPLIKNVNFRYQGLGDCHYDNFHSYRGGSSQSSTNLTQQSGNYKTGN